MITASPTPDIKLCHGQWFDLLDGFHTRILLFGIFSFHCVLQETVPGVTRIVLGTRREGKEGDGTALFRRDGNQKRAGSLLECLQVDASHHYRGSRIAQVLLKRRRVFRKMTANTVSLLMKGYRSGEERLLR